MRWKYGLPPKGNANFGWIQHIIHHLAPDGMAGFVSANGAMSSNQSGEGEIRRAIIEADLVDCIVALPGQLFYSTQIPVCLWFLTKNKKADAKRGFRDRRKETLFIDARKMGTLIDRVHRELTDQLIANRIQSRTFATLRDTLLPKLLSGELSVAEASIGWKVSTPSMKSGLDRLDPMDSMKKTTKP